MWSHGSPKGEPDCSLYNGVEINSQLTPGGDPSTPYYPVVKAAARDMLTESIPDCSLGFVHSSEQVLLFVQDLDIFHLSELAPCQGHPLSVCVGASDLSVCNCAFDLGCITTCSLSPTLPAMDSGSPCVAFDLRLDFNCCALHPVLVQTVCFGSLFKPARFLSSDNCDLAPKRRIGGSGTSARSSLHGLSWAHAWAAFVVVPFFCSLLLVALLALLGLLLRPIFLGRRSGSFADAFLFRAVPLGFHRCWDVFRVPRGPPLRFRPPPFSKKARICKRSPVRSSFAVRLCAALIGFATFPLPVWAAPEGLHEALGAIDTIVQACPEDLGISCHPYSSPHGHVPATQPACEICKVDQPVPTPRHCVILQSEFPAQYLLAYVHIPCSVETFAQAAAELGEPRLAGHTLKATVPQVADGLASLVAIPPWLSGTDKTVYVLDFSYWNGPVYAVLDWSFVTIASLASAARKHASASWHVFYAGEDLPFDDQRHVIAEPGSVFTFVPTGSSPGGRFLIEQLVGDPRLWSSCPGIIPRETSDPQWLALRSHVTRTPVYAGTNLQELWAAAADAFHSALTDLDFSLPHDDSPLQDIVYQGNRMRGVLAAEPKLPSGTRQDVFVFLDLRLVGLSPTFCIRPPGWLSLKSLIGGLALNPPDGFAVVPSGVPFDADQVEVSVSCTLALHFARIDAVTASASGTTVGHGLASFGLDEVNAVGHPEARQEGPREWTREPAPTPDPEVILAAAPRPAEDIIEVFTACFYVFMPHYQHEIVHLALQAPCHIDDALTALADHRDTGIAVHFDQLIPATPQPDVSFGSVIAFPAWLEDQRIVLVDSRDHDGRLFATIFTGRFNRASVLQSLQIQDLPGLQVFLRHALLDTGTWYTFGQGDTLTIKPPGTVLPPIVLLSDMLRDTWDWAAPGITFHGPHFPAFCVLTDGGLRVVLVDVEQIRSFTDFKQFTSGLLQFRSAQAVFCSSQPRVTDFAVLGQSCKAVLVATEAVVRVPIPPGRLQMHRPIAFLDRRPILQELGWVIAEQGLIDLDPLLASFQDRIPTGYVANVTGAPTEIRYGRTYLRITNGTLLTVTCVEELPTGSDSGQDSSSPADDDDDPDASDDQSSRDGKSREPGGSDSTEAPRAPSRSRSPPPTRGSHSEREVCSSLSTAKVHCLSADPSGQCISGLGTCIAQLVHCNCEVVWDAFVSAYRPGEGDDVCQQHMLLSKGRPHASGPFLLAVGPSSAPRACKTLDEPTNGTPALQQAVAFLRYAAPRLGIVWRYSAPSHALHILSDSDSDLSGDEDEAGALSLHFAVLSIGFAPEHVVVRIELPATQPEALDQVQRCRAATAVELFPVIFPANLQPCSGSGVVIAVPAWSIDPVVPTRVLCLDTSAFDGRIFAAQCPAYVSRRHLLILSQLPRQDEIEVHAAGDPIPLGPDGQFQVDHGDTFVFVPPGIPIHDLHTLGAALLAPRLWASLSRFPTPPERHCGLVHERETILFDSLFDRPTEYRSQIAACIGIRTQDLRLFPATPRVRNASLHGFFCSAVVAVGELTAAHPLSPYCILIDSRALHLGWQTWTAVAGRISCNALRVALQSEIPSGWRVCLQRVPDHVDHLEVSPGQVLVAVCIQTSLGSDSLGIQAPLPSQGEQPSLPVGAPQGVSTDEPPSTADSAGYEQPSPDGEGGGVTGTRRNPHRRVSFFGEAYGTCSFLVLGQNYLTEHVEVRLPRDIDEEDALRIVSAARAPADASCLPSVLAVYPQPCGSHALCVAVPEWSFPGAVVAIDSRSINGRLFALHIVGTVNRAALFVAAQLDASADIDVYIGNQPWPLQDGPSVALFRGELVLFTPSQAPHHTVTSLQDMLRDPAAWDQNFDPSTHAAGGFSSLIWVMGDESSFPFEVRPDRQRHFRADLATAVGVSSRELVLQPAGLSVSDFSYKGLAMRTLIAALNCTGFLPSLRSRHVICFIDARPVLLGVTWQVCPDGLLDIVANAVRFGARCPAGFRLCMLRSDFTELPLDASAFVEDGEVIIVVFRRALRSGSAPPTSHDPPDDDDAGSGDDDRDFGQNGPRHASDDPVDQLPPTSAAGTGGTSNVLEQSDGSASECNDKWPGSSFTCAVLAGACWTTPVVSEGSAPKLVPAVCGARFFDARSDILQSLVFGIRDWFAFKASLGFGIAILCWIGYSFEGTATDRLLRGSLGLCIAVLQSGCLSRTQTFRPGSCSGPLWVALCVVILCHQVAAAPLAAGRVANSHSALSTAAPLSVALCAGVQTIHRVPACDEASVRRPLPTPARALRLPDVDHVLGPDRCLASDIGALNTLLECSLAEPDSPAMFLAATLLEALFEHFGSSWPLCTEQASPPAAPVIHLSEFVPTCCVHDVTCVNMKSAIAADRAAKVLSSFWELPSTLPVGIQWHPRTSLALASHVPFPQVSSQPISRIDVFTDGSFDGAVSSWAFAAVASVQSGVFLLAWARGRVALHDTAGSIGATEHSAVNGERSALFWSLAWLLGVHTGIQRVVHSDCLVAGGQTNGLYGSAQHAPIAIACRSLAQVLETLGGFDATSIRHIKGHSGQPYNELADTLAGSKDIPDTQIPHFLAPLSEWAIQGTLPWLWLTVATFRRPTQWPKAQGDALVDPYGNSTLDVQSLTPADLFGPSISDEATSVPAAQIVWLQTRLVSVNVQSLGEDEGSALPNRVPFVREQLSRIECAVAALQETRAKHTSTVVSTTHIRFLSARDSKGCFGVELWFARTVPYGWIGQRPLFFEIGDFRVLHWTPRQILVRFTKGSLRILFVTCHAPTADHPERDAWWKQFTDKVLAFSNGDKVVVLGDLNLRVVRSLPGRIGSRLSLGPDHTPDHFYRLLEGIDLWIPSTYDGYHSGPDHTWVAPGGTSVSRIDYVLLPVTWDVPWEGSLVLHDVDFGQAGLDHFAVRLDTTVGFAAKLQAPHHRRMIDVAKACSPAASADIRDLCLSMPPVDWDVDAHRHYHLVSTHLLDGLAERYPQEKSPRRRTFFSDTTWMFRQQRTWLRRQAHSLSGDLSVWVHRCAFEAWACGLALNTCLVTGLASLLRNLSAVRHAVHELRVLKPQFRRSLRQDKRSHLSEVANLAMRSPTRDVVAKLRPLLGPPKRKQRGTSPLPALALEDGSMASTPEEADARWLRHFSSIERGGPISPAAYVESCIGRQREANLEMLEVCQADLPSKCDLEHAMRSARLGRACGNDSFPADILHGHAGSMAALFYPVLLKTAYRLQEPIQFKGGTVKHLWKQKGAHEVCTSYRGILISSTVGKAIHASFRRRCSPWLDQAASPLQVGGRRGFPVQLAAQAAREYQAGFLRSGRSAAIVFLDLREAFHRVVRPLVHGGDLSDAHLVSVLQTLQLPPGKLDDLRAYVRSSSLIADAGASEWASDMIREFQTDSWMTIGSGLAAVEDGTRPGDALADVVFSFLFAAVLGRIRDALPPPHCC